MLTDKYCDHFKEVFENISKKLKNVFLKQKEFRKISLMSNPKRRNKKLKSSNNI